METKSPGIVSFLLAAIFVLTLSFGVFNAFGVDRSPVESVYNAPDLEGGRGFAGTTEVGIGGAPPASTTAPVPCEK